MISPYVRRRRLGIELARLRDASKMPAETLAQRIGIGRQRLSRLENGHIIPDLEEIMRLLETLGADQRCWTQVMDIARDARERGWWERWTREMGPRQALYANLEAGAAAIFEYHLTFLPGLMQLPEFTRFRAECDRDGLADDFQTERAVTCRRTRQQMIQRPGGPSYEVIIDELAIRRHTASPDLVAAQLEHIVAQARPQNSLCVRVLPLAARIGSHSVPRSAFSRYEYPDPDDPTIVTVDTVTSDLVLTEPAEVTRYRTLFDRLRDAALPPAGSLTFIENAAESLHRQVGAPQ
ncbi:transcriptional regulator [Pilimelia anulata]|uniref:Transcriptional regulator n=1 Tax=Pilimelia anulata TaxID=53371 RepID=A0A8J3F813_9ACTN|nr:helix-turn-helix transcriptional regulator [Pilimelia anulata]GGJ75340.1 transcriptional regulator [Pilimelia anulata]